MEKLGFLRVAAAVPLVKTADCNYNILQIEKLIKEAAARGARIVVLPELAITGYTCMDLFTTQTLKKQSILGLEHLLNATAECNIIAIVGTPVYQNNKIFNCAAVMQGGKLLGVAAKSHIPNYNEFQELRWFSPASELESDTINLCGQSAPIGNNLIFKSSINETEIKFAIEICEDLWAPVPVSSMLATAGAQIIFNSSASNEAIGKHNYLLSLIKQQSSRCISGYVYASAGFGESSTDLVFAGNAIIAEKGNILSQSKRFSFEEQLTVTEIDINYLQHDRTVNNTFSSTNSPLYSYEYAEIDCGELITCNSSTTDHTDTTNITNTIDTIGNTCHTQGSDTLLRYIDPHPFVPQGAELNTRCEEIFNIQVAGLAKRLVHTNCKNVVVGISGGLDSTLALLVATRTFDALGYSRKGILAITMPGFGTTGRTYNNALALMQSLDVTIKEISIKESCLQHFKDIEHNPDNHNVVYENSQARERTQILMDVANMVNGMVIGTGDLSELALGWATYNGDHMSMYGVNGGIPKTLVKSLVIWVANNSNNEVTRTTLLDIADTPISPELIPAYDNGNIKQKTEDLVGPYELHDFYLYHFMRYGASPAKIYAMACKAFEGEHDKATIKKWLAIFFRRFFNQQFKRSCLPDGPKAGSISLSPRGDWRMPSDASSAIWLNEIENL